METGQILLPQLLESIHSASELRARFVAKGYSQHVNDPIVVDCYAATTFRLRASKLYYWEYYKAIRLLPWPYLRLSSTRHYRRRSAYNTQEWYYSSPTSVWRLKKAMYGLRTSPKLWQLHLGAVQRQQNLRQCKADRCLWTTAGLGVLVYVDDLLLVGETTKMEEFIATLKATFTLKHVTTLSRTQDVRFLGKRLHLHEDNSISISLEPSYMLRPYQLHGKKVKTVTTTCLEQQPLQDREMLSPLQHSMFRTTVGQLIWASLDRPDLMYAAKLHSSRPPVERDPRNLKHTLRYVKGTTHYKLYIGRGLADYPTYLQRFCHFPTEQHSIRSTLLHRF